MTGELHPWNRTVWAGLELPGRPLPASLLLTGPHGVGKSAFALHLAQGLLCVQPLSDGQPCRSCQSCRLFTGDNHPDFRLVQEAGAEEEQGEEEGPKRGSAAARWIRIDQIRDLGPLLELRSHLGRPRVIVIQPADRLNANAANALLKTLEEPPAEVHFILVTAAARRLPATILSRCVQLTFHLPDSAGASAWLQAQGVDRSELALAQAGGAPLAARALDAEFWSRRERLVNLVLASPDFDPVQASERMTADELAFLVGGMQRWCHDLLLTMSVRTVRYNPDRAQILHQLAARSDPQRLLGFLRELQSIARFLEHPLNPRLVAERCMIGYKRTLT